MASIQESLQRLSGINGSSQECANALAFNQSPTGTAITPVTVKGGVVRVIDSATGDIAVTNNAWIEDEKYGWAFVRDVANVSAEFDTAVTRTGTKTLKFSNTDTSGRCHVDTANGAASTISVGNSKYLISVKGSTSYRVSFYYKTTNKTSGTICVAMTYNAALTRLTQNSGPTVSGTNNWTLGTFTFTSDATATGLVIRFQNGAGAVEDTWIDVNSMTLEEVSSITNSGSFPALYYPKATAVTSTDNIGDNLDPTGAFANTYAIPTSISETSTNRQTLALTKKNQTGVRIWPVAKGTGDWTVTVHDASNNVIGTPATIANASVTTGALLSFLNSFTWTSGTYHFHVTSTVADGTLKTNTSNDLEACSFTCLYSKNTTNLTVATDTQTVSVTAPTVDGWADGTIIDTSNYGVTPLTLAVGANNVYFSSNGPTTADGTVDPSLQATISGKYGTLGGTLLSLQEASNYWAGTSGKTTQDAMNTKASTSGLSTQEALNRLSSNL